MSDDELIAIARDFRDGILGGRPSDMTCAMVSWPLAGYLQALCGVDCEAVESDLGHMNHIWIKLPDGRALDATADQFSDSKNGQRLPPVYLGERLSIHP